MYIKLLVLTDHLWYNFHEDPLSSFCMKLLRDRETDKNRRWINITSFAEVSNGLFIRQYEIINNINCKKLEFYNIV